MLCEQSAWLSQQKNNWQQWQSMTAEQQTLNDQIQHIIQQLNNKLQNKQKADEVVQELQRALDRTRSQLQQQQQRTELFGQKVVIDERQRLKSLVTEAQTHYQQTQSQLKTIDQQFSQLAGVISQQTRELEALAVGLNQADTTGQTLLNDSSI